MITKGLVLPFLRRIRVSPQQHLGRPSYDLLKTFADAFLRTLGKDYQVYVFEPFFTEFLQQKYGTAGLDSDRMILEIAPSDEAAFHLFFAELDSALSVFPNELKLHPSMFQDDVLPVSSYLAALSERPEFFLRKVSVEHLRVFVDGYCLGAEERGRFDCVDLDGFDQWIRSAFNLKGSFRWESAIRTRCNGSDSEVVQWTLGQLSAFRESKGRPKAIGHELVRGKVD